MHPSFEQFVAALRDPAQRPGIGLSISDEDAAALLTNATWANDYYARWIELFPPATPEPALVATPAPAALVPAASVPAAFAAVEPAAPTSSSPFGSSPFGPPPSGPSTQASPYATADTLDWAAPRRRSTSPARIAIIAVLTVVTLAIIAGVINEVVAVTRAPAVTAAHTPATVAPPSPDPTTAASNDPIVFHGLTQTEYDLMEAILAPQGHSLEEAVAQGTNDAKLHQLAISTQAETAKSCTDGESLPNGFDDANFRAAFIAGYESTQKATAEQSAAVYDALAAYCDAH